MVAVSDGCWPVETSATLLVEGGQTFTWAGETGNWGDPNQWTPSGVPSLPEDLAIIDNAGSVHIDDSFVVGAIQAEAGTLTFEWRFNRLSFDQLNAGLGGQPFDIFSNVGGELSGDVTLGPDGRIVAVGGELVHVAGMLTMQPESVIDIDGSDAAFTSSGGLKLLEEGLSEARIDVSGGGTLNVVGGSECDGTITVTDGALSLSGAGVFLGRTGTGQVLIDGPTSLLESSATLWLGTAVGTHGALYLLNGAELRLQSADVVVGDSAGGRGTFIVDGSTVQMGLNGNSTIWVGASTADSVWQIVNGSAVEVRQGGVRIGDTGGGRLNLDGAGSQMAFGPSAVSIHVGDQPGDVGVVEVTGGAHVTGGLYELYVGGYGFGELIIDGEGTEFTVTVSDTTLGAEAGGIGLMTVRNGAQCVLSEGGLVLGLNLGESGSGTLTVQDTGTLCAAEYVDIGSGSPTSAGQLTVEGGARFECSNLLVYSSGTMTVHASEFSVDTAFTAFGPVEFDGATVCGEFFQTYVGIVAAASTLDLSQVIIHGGGYIDEQGSGSSWILRGDFENASTANVLWDTDQTEFRFDGGTAAVQSLEVASRDVGPFTAGYVDNFAIGTLMVGPTTTSLVLNSVEDNSPGAEALYVIDLVLEGGTTLDLNGFNLYYASLIDNGATIILNGGQLVEVTLCDVPSGPDCNENGVPDECDIAEGYSLDDDGDGVPDECGDCNENGVPDVQDIEDGTSQDCNANQIPDECDIASGESNDCNSNAVPDECDLSIAAPAHLCWVSLGFDAIRRTDLDGAVVEDVLTGLNLANAVTVDAAEGKIYWSEAFPHNDIWRANLDGSGIEQIVPAAGEARGLALDGIGGIYWTYANGIRRSQVDGGEVTDVVTGMDDPMGIALDMANGKVYWTDSYSRQINRANLDGGDLQTIVVEQDNVGRAFAIDPAGGKMYWAASESGGTNAPRNVRRANLDGSTIEDIVEELDNPQGMAVDSAGAKVYWTDRDDNHIRRASLDGSVVEDVITTGLSQPFGLAIAEPVGSFDCNENTVPDECDIADGTSLDLNGNGIPDECEGP